MRRAGKSITARPATLTRTVTTFGFVKFGRIFDPRGRRWTSRFCRQRAGHGVYHLRINQRLVALDVHHRRSQEQRATTSAMRSRAAGMIGAGSFPPGRIFFTASAMRESSVTMMTSSSDLRLFALFNDVLDEGLARNERKRLAGDHRR